MGRNCSKGSSLEIQVMDSYLHPCFSIYRHPSIDRYLQIYLHACFINRWICAYWYKYMQILVIYFYVCIDSSTYLRASWSWFYFCAETCRFCLGTGSITVELDLNEKEVSRCVNCEGAGSITCTTCQGSGVQPRYLDRRQALVYDYA
jgi:hypothetical protein